MRKGEEGTFDSLTQFYGDNIIQKGDAYSLILLALVLMEKSYGIHESINRPKRAAYVVSLACPYHLSDVLSYNLVGGLSLFYTFLNM